VAGSFYNFVYHIDSEMARFWKNTRIQKVEVLKERKTWQFSILIEEPIKSSIVKNTIKTLLASLPFLEHIKILLFPFNYSQLVSRILTCDHQGLSSYLFNNPDMLGSLNIQINDNRIDIIADNQDLYTMLIDDEICDRLSGWFYNEYCLTPIVRVVKEAIETEPTDADYPSSSGGYHLLAIEPQYSAKKKPRRKRPKSKSLAQMPALPIAELEEGLKAVVVQGEIWDKQANTLKDGRILMTYSLTDYNDSILVKSFLERPEDDSLQIGEWIAVRGSIRYDTYVRELVLFMDSYESLGHRTRVDNSKDKRIELHAHTKMSAMDGVADVTMLIKKAAEWGHPAIAITDHGTVQAFPNAYSASRDYNIKVIYGVEAYLVSEDKKEYPYHIILLAANEQGLRNLYYLVSISYLDYFYRHPKIPRAELEKHREGILVGSACEAGELFGVVMKNEPEEIINQIASFYDYFEIQPVENNLFLIRAGKVKDEDELRKINQTIVELGKKLGKPVVATGDVHFIDPEHEIFRRIIQAGQGYEDAEAQAPLYFRNTEEMLKEFAYLGTEDARKVVIENPLIINNRIKQLKPVPEGFYPPQIESAESEIIELTWKRARLLYGDNPPAIVTERIERELASITKHGFSVLYLIAHKLVKKSNQDGYLVGSRGSVGSSLVAFLTGITEVNPISPHYLCPECKYTEFFLSGETACGVDLPAKKCVRCGSELLRDGFDIPFETFLGFEGDKIPDIDLNFSGDYQYYAHQYVEELFGKENVFRAGTISTIAEKTAYGFVKKYAEERNIEIRNVEIMRLVQGITGVRRTTGQHPGGLIVVPHDHDIYEFTPLQHPADNKDSGVITTHFEYHAIGDQLVKLDILGHDDPTVLKVLEDLTGIKADSISLSDAETMKIFSGLEPLGVVKEQVLTSVGTYGIPEFGTRFVRQMLETTRPQSFGELIRISGLSHGTDVWLNNAQSLILEGVADLKQVICIRDDIMIYLIQKGLEKQHAFRIMEQVRKGRGLSKQEIALMLDCGVPQWYIDSCQKIKYMFPKAHAVAYVTMAFRIAYFKVYYPLEFYASFFTIRAEDFDIYTVLEGYDAVRKRIMEIEEAGLSASQKDRKLLPVLEVVLEMYARGFSFYPIDIYKSDAEKFLVEGKGLRLPFSALPNIGVSAAQGIVKAREEKKFLSIEDFQVRTHLNKTGMDLLRKNQCLAGLPETTQISLFK
jgi:DNA polymerase-3 subunit alpha (Gram-positive type)